MPLLPEAIAQRDQEMGTADALEGGADVVHAAVGGADSGGHAGVRWGRGCGFVCPEEVRERPAAVAVKALRCAPTATRR